MRIEERLRNDGGGTGWSRAWLINFLARLGDGAGVEEHLNALIGKYTFPNLLNMHPPFQIDGNFGVAAGIAEALVQSHEGFLHLLPALPPSWMEGAAHGLRARGGFTVDLFWKENALEKAVIHGMKPGMLEVRVGGVLPMKGIFEVIPDRAAIVAPDAPEFQNKEESFAPQFQRPRGLHPA